MVVDVEENSCHTDRAKEEGSFHQNLRTRLQERVIGQHRNPATRFIANVVLKSIDAPSSLKLPNRPFRSYLFLGLNTLGHIELLKGLSDNMKTEDGDSLLITIDMQQSSSSKACGIHWGMILDAVRKRPHSVLLFNRVELADAYAYNTLLKILDNGMLIGSEGSAVDFRNATLVLMTDLGDWNFIKGLFGYSYTKECHTQQPEEEGRFRAELLYRVDEIVFFNPLACKQTEIGRLSMIEGPQIPEVPAPIPILFFTLFEKVDNRECNRRILRTISAISDAVKMDVSI